MERNSFDAIFLWCMWWHLLDWRWAYCYCLGVNLKRLGHFFGLAIGFAITGGACYAIDEMCDIITDIRYHVKEMKDLLKTIKDDKSNKKQFKNTSGEATLRFPYIGAAPKKVNKSLKLCSKFGDIGVTIDWYTCHHGGISYET